MYEGVCRKTIGVDEFVGNCPVPSELLRDASRRLVACGDTLDGVARMLIIRLQ